MAFITLDEKHSVGGCIIDALEESEAVQKASELIDVGIVRVKAIKIPSGFYNAITDDFIGRMLGYKDIVKLDKVVREVEVTEKEEEKKVPHLRLIK